MKDSRLQKLIKNTLQENIEGILRSKMNLTADDFLNIPETTPKEKLLNAFKTAYLRGNRASQDSLKTLLDQEPYSELEDYVKEVDAAFTSKGTTNVDSRRQFSPSTSPSIGRNDYGGGLFEEQLRMQLLAGLITETEYKEKLNKNY
jgi:hypothetical protein